MYNNLNICLDLGRSSLKVSFGFSDSDSSYYGKIVQDSPMMPSYIPSIAYYREDEKRWLFGNEIDRVQSNSFYTIVRIKDLLSMVDKVNSKDSINSYNEKCFYEKTIFPKFIFPTINEIKTNGNNLKYLSENEYVFEGGITPRELCKLYFEFVHGIVLSKIQDINDKYGSYFYDFTVSVIYPNRASKKYVNEYKSLIEEAFNKKIYKSVSSTRALAYYAKYLKKIRKGDEFLVFDIGDEDISVSKAHYDSHGEVFIDGVDGHNSPLKVGGNDIDDNIGELIDDKISKRETIGCPSFGEIGHIMEKGLVSKQFLLNKNIKQAKIVLSSDDDLCDGNDYTLIDINREVFFQVPLSKAELKTCAGIEGNKYNFADTIADYIAKELNRVSNRNTSKIFIAGGVIETIGLKEYIEKRLKNLVKRKINVHTFEREVNENDVLGISEYEDSSYSACMGGNYVSINDIPIRLCLSLTYASNYTYLNQYYARVLAKKGSPLNENEHTVFAVSGKFTGEADEEIYTFDLREDELCDRSMENYRTNMNGKGVYLVGVKGNHIRDIAFKEAGMKVILSNKVVLRYRGTCITTNDYYNFIEVIDVDEEGRGLVDFKPDNFKNPSYISINYYGSIRVVPTRDISVELKKKENSIIKMTSSN